MLMRRNADGPCCLRKLKRGRCRQGRVGRKGPRPWRDQLNKNDCRKSLQGELESRRRNDLCARRRHGLCVGLWRALHRWAVTALPWPARGKSENVARFFLWKIGLLAICSRG